MPVVARPLIVVAVGIYFLLVLAIGVWAARRTRNAKDFFIAGQRVGLFVTGLGTMSAAFSGFVFLGGPGLTYRLGFSSFWILLPVGFTAGLLCWLPGKRLRLLSGIREVYTVPDAIACRFGGTWAPAAAAVAVVVGTVAYLGAQLLALGVLLQAIFGLDSLASGMGIGLCVLVAYSAAGGMVAGAYTDLAQGILMLLGAVAIFGQALHVTGGWAEMTRSIAESPSFGPAFLEPLGNVAPLTAFGFFFVFGVGILGQPQMLHKFYMLADVRKLKWMPLVLGSSQAVCLLIWVGIGLAVPALVARGQLTALERADDAAPLFLLNHTPDLLAGLVLAGVIAAIMSTADSFMNLGAAALVRDLPRAFGRPVADELTWGRRMVVVISVVAALVAYAYGDLIALLGTFAFGTFAAALAPALGVGLAWDRVTRGAAIASIVTGLVLNLGLELFPGALLPQGVLPSAVALAASFAVLFGVSWCSPREPIDPALRELIEG
jgi:Na+/proline symporter